MSDVSKKAKTHRFELRNLSYQDAIQPVAQEIGKVLGTIGKAVNLVLKPLDDLVWRYGDTKEFLERDVSKKLENVPVERIKPPPLNVVGPAVEALRFTGHDETLRDMFANLIANSLDTNTVFDVHPSFVDIIKNLSPVDGRILKLFASTTQYPIIEMRLHTSRTSYHVHVEHFSHLGKFAGISSSTDEHPFRFSNNLENLCRLGLLTTGYGVRIDKAEAAYQSLESDPLITEVRSLIENSNDYVQFERGHVSVVGFGRQFISACVIDKRGSH